MWDYWQYDGASVANHGAWLTTLTRNLSLTHRRLDLRRDDLMPRVAAHFQRLDEPIEEVVHRRHLLSQAMQIIDTMKPSLREPFIAYALHGETLTEVAQTYGLSVGSVRRRIEKARQILAAAFGDESERSDRSERSDGSDGSGRSDWSDGLDGSSVGSSLLDQIAWYLRDTCVVHIKLPTGGTLEYHAQFGQTVGRRTQRIEALERYVSSHGRGLTKRFQLANLLIAESRLEEAETHLRRMIELQPRHLPSSLLLGQLLVLRRRLDDAVAVYEAAQQHVVSSATRFHLQGLIERARSGVVFPQYAVSQREDHLQRSVDAFNAAIAEEPTNLAHYHELALTYETWGKPVEALAAYDAALKVDPDDVYALARSHNSLFAQSLHQLVLARLERAVELDPNYAYALKLLVDRRSNLGLVRGEPGRRTLALAKRLVCRNPDSADALDAYTRYFDCRCEFDHSVALWREFLTRNPSNAKAWIFYGTALTRVGDLQGAGRAYIRSHTLDPDCLDVYWRGLPALITSGNASSAWAWLRELQSRFPNHWDAAMRAAYALLSLGEPGAAVEAAARGVQLAPHVRQAWGDFGNVLYRAGRYEEALDAFQRAVSICSGQTAALVLECRLWMARTLKALGRHAEATKTIREVISEARARSDQDPAYMVVQGRALLEMEDYAGAQRALQRALNAGAWSARWDLEQLRERLASGTAGKGGPEDE